MVPRFCSSSSLVMPMPLSLMRNSYSSAAAHFTGKLPHPYRDRAARRGKLDGIVQNVISHLMDEVGVRVDQHLFIHGQAFQIDHAVIDALLRRKGHTGERLPDVEHPAFT